MPNIDQEDRKLKAEIDEIMKRVNRTLEKIEALDPGKQADPEDSGQ